MSAKNTYVLSVLGQDRPGIVAAVSRVLTDSGCNIEDSSMTTLLGAFAMLLVITAPETAGSGLRSGLADMATRERLLVHLDPYPDGEPRAVQGDRYTLTLHGADHPGIVAVVTGLLAELGINIVDLATRVVEGQVPLYIMTMEVAVPSRVERTELEGRLAAVSREINCAITLRPVETLEL